MGMACVRFDSTFIFGRAASWISKDDANERTKCGEACGNDKDVALSSSNHRSVFAIFGIMKHRMSDSRCSEI